MKISYSEADVLKGKGDALVLPLFCDFAENAAFLTLNEALGGALLARTKKASFKGRDSDSLRLGPLVGFPYDELLLLGLGERGAQSGEKLWSLGVRVVAGLRTTACKNAALWLALGDCEKPEQGLAALAQGLFLGEYRFDRYQSKARENAETDLSSLTLYTAMALPAARAKAALKRGEILAEGVAIARDLANEPPNVLTPAELARRVTTCGRAAGFTVKVEDEKQIKARKMGLFLAVAQGSSEKPRLITMVYTPSGAKAQTPPTVIVGKGLTFDSGGLCIKDGNGMEHMKADMAGAAAVVGAMVAIAKLKGKTPVVAIVAACENMPDGAAYKVGDILTGANGKTVEMLNSDAEGRLTLGDALVYAESFGPSRIVDLATLTGACVVALGEDQAGLFCTDDALAGELVDSFRAGGDELWRMPLNPRMKRLIKSDVADMKNIGGRWGGAITAALFLKEFVEKTPWAHLDIAGPSWLSAPLGPHPKGASGFGVAGLVEWLAPQ